MFVNLASYLIVFQKPNCVNHKANHETTSSHANIDVKGTLGCACAPHGCVVPGSMVNMYFGERYVIFTMSHFAC
jgi:hypothetical protein